MASLRYVLVRVLIIVFAVSLWQLNRLADAGSIFRASEFFSTSTLAANPPLFQSIELYANQHSWLNIVNDTRLCERKFAVATYACPQRVGNRMDEFLNSFIGAFVTNRTLLWQFCTRKACQLDFVQDCDIYLTRNPWMPSYADVATLWKRKCMTVPVASSSAQDIYVPEIIPMKFRFQAEKIFICCGIDGIPHPFINFGTHDVHELHSLTFPQTRLQSHAKRRVVELFAVGEHFAYGVLFRTAFTFTRDTVGRNDRYIIDALNRHYGSRKVGPYTATDFVDVTFIGFHLRHSRVWNITQPDRTEDGAEEQCLPRLISKYRALNGPQRCVILFATDRDQRLSHFRSSAMRRFKCLVVTTEHNYSKIYNPLSENGPFTGGIAMQDIELLSRSDVLLGSTYIQNDFELYGMTSTFSLLIAALRATNGRPHSTRKDMRPFWLPSCQHIDGGNRYFARGLYRNANGFECGNSVEKSLLLDFWCPYWNRTHLGQVCTGGPLCSPYGVPVLPYSESPRQLVAFRAALVDPFLHYPSN